VSAPKGVGGAMGVGGDRERLVLRDSDDYRGKNILAPMVRVVCTNKVCASLRAHVNLIPNQTSHKKRCALGPTKLTHRRAT
jgi:hypothetical protein